MKRNLNNKLLHAIQKGSNEVLFNYDLTTLDDEDSILVKNNTYKHSSIYDDLIDRFSEFLDDDKIFKGIIEKMILIGRQYIVKDKKELKQIIKKSIKIFGNECDLNWVDTSQIIDMSYLFQNMTKFNGHIEKWDVSNVKDMCFMFSYTESFNQPIGDWNVSNVKDMGYMFDNAKTFNQSIGNWDVSNVENMSGMFWFADSFNQPIDNWDINNVKDIHFMFDSATSFNQNISNWNISNVKLKNYIFINCPIKEEYKPKFK